ncbi:Arm DNA-binding domain-containing protein [Flavobacterium sp. XS2P39]|uniref:Arm DNA-binding domain-containing protein n=1 Tax=Flavobacterium sp. XS2P39 TaxID=3401725 RepID=UPI003AAC34F9
MLENSFGLSFFLKTPKNKSSIRYIYLRVTVDGKPKETSTKRTWDIQRWDPKTERATGNKEDARSLNHFLDAMASRINQFKMDLIYN